MITDLDSSLMHVFQWETRSNQRYSFGHSLSSSMNIPSQDSLRPMNMYHMRSVGYLLTASLMKIDLLKDCGEIHTFLNLIYRTVPLAQDPSIFYCLEALFAVLWIANHNQSDRKRFHQSSTSSQVKSKNSSSMENGPSQQIKNSSIKIFKEILLSFPLIK